MIDTIILRSPFIIEDLASRIEGECLKRIGLDLKSGELMYEITTGELKGSFENRISIKVLRKKYISTPVYHNVLSKKFKVDNITTLKDCEPYIQIECSVHKALLGHNCYNGPRNFQLSCLYIIKLIEKLIDVNFNTNVMKWEVIKVDIAEVFDLKNNKIVRDWFTSINVNNEYSRRKVMKYGNDSFQVPGQTTTSKCYSKGIEFYKHDYKKLKLIDGINESEIYSKALNIIRFECSIKNKKMKYDLNKEVILVEDLSIEYLENVYDNDVDKIFKEVINNMEIVRDCLDVKNRLYDEYGDLLANTLLCTWYKLTTIGEKQTKEGMKEPTYYRHKKQLLNVGVSWIGTNVVLKNKVINFTPNRNSEYIVKENCDELLIKKLFELENAM